MAEIEELKGKVLTSIENLQDEELIFTCEDGSKYRMYHSQDCCEDVSIDDIVGELDDLLNSPILLAEEVVSTEMTDEQKAEMEDEKLKCEKEGRRYYGYTDESFTWTFYKLSTIKGDVTIKWYGQSNGYYSESVDFVKADENGNFSRW